MPPVLENSNPARTGVLLVGHGTRSELGRRQCQALADEIAAGLDQRLYAAELAYLELASPTIDEGLARLIVRPIERLVVVPLLLFAAGHAKEDIPAAVRSALAAAGVPNIPLTQTDPLGLQEPIVELAAARFHAAAESPITPADTCLLLIGRGSRDAAATAEMRQLGEILQRRARMGLVQVGFLAMAQPSAQELIHSATASNFRQIVVQPHLLFDGELLDRLRNDVFTASTRNVVQTWRTSRVLGEESSTLASILRQGILSAGNR